MITIRKAVPGDLNFIEAHAYRLLDFGPPDWRNQAEMTPADIRHISDALLSDDPKRQVFIAIDETAERIGFSHLTLQQDYYSNEWQAHLTDLVVIASVEGKGVGRRFLEHADEWARENNCRWITLNVFDKNQHAQQVYEKLGYQKEWVRYLKLL